MDAVATPAPSSPTAPASPSPSAGGFALDPAVASARTRVAEALRAASHALVGHETSVEELLAAASDLEAITRRLAAGAERQRPRQALGERYLEPLPEPGSTLGGMPDRPWSGRATPYSIPFDVRFLDGWCVTRLTLGPAHEGAPGRSHGGFVAGIYDDLTGFVLGTLGIMAYTGELTVRYLDGTPIGEELLFRARLARRERRKITVEAEGWHGPVKISTASALFIQIPSERLGLPAGLREA